MKITLYQAAIEEQNKINLCVDEETGELDIEKLHQIEGTFINKCVAVTAVIKQCQVNVLGLIRQRQAVMAQFDNAINGQFAVEKKLHSYLLDAMKATNTLSIKSDDGLLQATLFIDRDESIELDADVVFADSLLNPQKPAPARTPSKDLIKKAILAGEPVAGARIVRKDRLTIK